MERVGKEARHPQLLCCAGGGRGGGGGDGCKAPAVAVPGEDEAAPDTQSRPLFNLPRVQVPLLLTPDAKSRILQGEASVQKQHIVQQNAMNALFHVGAVLCMLFHNLVESACDGPRVIGQPCVSPCRASSPRSWTPTSPSQALAMPLMPLPCMGLPTFSPFAAGHPPGHGGVPGHPRAPHLHPPRHAGADPQAAGGGRRASRPFPRVRLLCRFGHAMALGRLGADPMARGSHAYVATRPPATCA